MVEKYDFEPYYTDVPFYLEEGNLNDIYDVQTDFGETDGRQFEKTLKKGDFVTLDTTKDFTVKKAEAGDEVLGRIIDTPRRNGNIGTTPNGVFHKRIATVRIFGHTVTELPIGEDNTALTVGDSVSLKSPNIFDKASTPNQTRVLRKAEALSGGTVAVLIGFVGV